MAEPPISDELKAFILEHVDSIEGIEVLLLLSAHRERTWTATEVSRELRSSFDSAANRLRALQTKRILREEGDRTLSEELIYRYGPQSEKMDFLIGRLAELYRTRRFSVMNLIFSKPAESIRTFADAFKIRKGDSKENG